MIQLKNQNILIISAHPDDEILGCGGIISQFNNFSRISIVFIGEGSSCRYNNLNDSSIKSDILDRETAAKNAANLFNINSLDFHNLTCGRLDQVPIIEINKIIENSIINYKPDILFTHDPHDVNNDHRIIFRSTIMSTRPQSKTSVKTLLSYEVPSSSECGFDLNGQFNPNVFIEISKSDLLNKYNALSKYESEINPFPFPRSYEGIKTYSNFRGMQAGVKYAEAFSLIRTFSHVS